MKYGFMNIITYRRLRHLVFDVDSFGSFTLALLKKIRITVRGRKYNDSQIFQPSDNNVIDTFFTVIQSSVWRVVASQMLGQVTAQAAATFPFKQQHSTPVPTLLSPMAIVSTGIGKNLNQRIVWCEKSEKCRTYSKQVIFDGYGAYLPVHCAQFTIQMQSVIVKKVAKVKMQILQTLLLQIEQNREYPSSEVRYYQYDHIVTF